MKIAILYTDNNPHAIARIKYFLKQGHEVSYIGLPHNGTHEVPDKVHHFPLVPTPLSRRCKVVKLLQYIFEIRKLSKEHSFDVLHVMWMPFTILAPFFSARKTVFELLGCDILNYPRNSRLYKWGCRIMFRFADAVTQGSSIAQNAGLLYGAPKENNEIIEVGIDFSLFNLGIPKGVARERHGISPTQKIVFSPRGFEGIYNIETILKAVPFVKAAFPDVMFVFAPSTGMKGEEFANLIQELGIQENVIFPGRVKKETELPFYYADANVMVSVPSTDSSPQSVYEAMACGIPVIVSELPWYQNKFEKDKELLTVPPRNEVALAEAIVGILRKKVLLDINSAYQKVYERINLDRENRKLEELYKRLLAS